MPGLRKTIVALFAVQVATGIVLMTVYSPSTTTAWGSTWYIQTQVPSGWLIRGVHHFASDALIVLLALFAGRIVFQRAYRGPGWRLWTVTLGCLWLTLALSLTGHLLPWDQEGFWGTKVRTNILAKAPLLGEPLAKLLLGGPDLGNLTLTRFYTLHVLVLPLAFAWLIRRRVAPPRRGDREWSVVPGASPPATRRAVGGAGLASLPDAAAVLDRDRERAGLVAISPLIVILAVFGATWCAHILLDSSLLDAPADPTATDYPARPEWHTLFLFQWLKGFEGPTAEVAGAILIPGAVTMLLFCLPWLQRLMPVAFADRIARGFCAALAAGILILTAAALLDDRNPITKTVDAIRAKQQQGEPLTLADQHALQARQFHEQRALARRTATRAHELAAAHGIPPTGPWELLAADPMTQGPRLFAAHCATCHRFDGHDALGRTPAEPATSSDLGGFASRDWIRGLLTDPMSPRYFGLMRTPEGDPAHTRMARFIRERTESADEEMLRQISADFDAVAAFLANQSGERKRPDLQSRERQPADTPSAAANESLIHRGREVFMSVCNECHSYDGNRTGTTRAPEMKNYGAPAWIERMIAEPDHETRYRSTGRERARMPSFRDRLTPAERRQIAEWLSNDR